MRLTPLRPGDDPDATRTPPRDPPPGPPAPLPVNDARLIWPPFGVLVVAAAIAWGLASALAASLRGEWFNMEQLGYVAGGVGYGLFAALFLWLDARAARGLPGGTWRSRRSMWGRTAASALIAAGAALVLGVLVVGALSALSQDRAASGGGDGVGGALVVSAAGVLVATIGGAVASVRARRRTRVASS